MMNLINLLIAHKEDLALLLTGLCTAASALANIFPKTGFLGKILHTIALNFNVA